MRAEMRFKNILLLSLIHAVQVLCAQNLIVNPGFETVDTMVAVLNQNDSFQAHHIPGWYNPSFTTTDYFNSDGNHAHCGSRYFGREIKAHSGNGFGGFYIENTRWREYIGIAFSEALVPGKNYHVEMYLASSVKCLYNMMSLQLQFWNTTDTIIATREMNTPRSNPTYSTLEIVNTGQEGMIDNWTKFSADFTATGGEKSMILGYFDDVYRTAPMPITSKNRMNDPYTYYYVDDVSLVRVDGAPLARGNSSKPIIYFDVNSAILKPASCLALDSVATRMKKNALLKIEVDGYTDVDASDTFNLDLSIKRAQAVADYIISKGISKSRITVKGFSENNQVSDEKALNRRVEFKYFQ